MRRPALRVFRARALIAPLVVTACLAVPALAHAAARETPAATVSNATPTNGRIAFYDFVTNQIYAANPDGTALTQLTHEPSGFSAQWPNWSPFGTHILFTLLNQSNGMGRIWVMNADGTGQRKIASDAPAWRDYQPKYTPDGKHIVFTRCPSDGPCAIWIMRSDGTRKHLVIPFLKKPTETSNFDPSVSPNGRHIAFDRQGYRGIISQVWVADISGRHAHPLTAPRLEAAQPTWSPNGTHISFVSNFARAQSGIYVMRANGTDVTRLALTKWPTNNFGPVYAPSGSQIAFSSDRMHPDLCCEDLFVMGADGSQQHLVATGLQGVIEVAWGTAPLIAAGSPGTLSHPPAVPHVSGSARSPRCDYAPPMLTGGRCSVAAEMRQWRL